ncbi:hypothetical protein NDU88_004156 [Pleurodeles waltl]|uniref:Uncharacterized protein n=1 Tax=Pleurodeles waltl TaxID=8319 RepID=A0AAV7M6B7_PLEWA|nr:hypothetical protein NDU88_004156 [Pleurodeles waltl]
MVLGIETALEHSKEELKEGEALERELLGDDWVSEAKQLLERLNKAIEDHNNFELKKKEDKVTKGIKNYSKEKAFPYSRDNYFSTFPAQDRQYACGQYKKDHSVTFSNSSAGSEDSDPLVVPIHTDTHAGQPFLAKDTRGGAEGEAKLSTYPQKNARQDER